MSVKVNISEKEAKAGDWDPLPSGRFWCVITNAEKTESKSEKNPGKPMLNFTFTVQDGKYANKEMQQNACLWDGAAYTIVNILKAIGEYENCFDGKVLTIPDSPSFYIGRDVDVIRGVNKKRKEENPDDDASMWVDIRRFAPHDAKAATGASSTAKSGGKASSLLP